MARVAPVESESAAPRSRELLAEQVASHGRATNMKRTLAHSPTEQDSRSPRAQGAPKLGETGADGRPRERA